MADSLMRMVHCRGSVFIVKDILVFRGTGDYDQYYLATEFTIR